MDDGTPAAAVEDPRIARSRALILDAATTCFVAHGYDGTSLEDIAATAGLAKRTIYNIYGDKATLFRATIQRSIDVAEGFTAGLADDAGRIEQVDRDLRELAVRLASTVLLGPVIPLRRLLVSEAGRFPDLALEYRRRAPEAVMRALAKAFRDLAARGLLAVDDAELAAEHFAFLIMGADLDRGMFLAPDRPDADLVRRKALTGADVFLRAYAPGR